MIFIFYNKLLLRAFALLTGAGIGICAWKYIALSAEKLPQQGAKDALAIVSFLIAGWLVMLIAEVADNHYVRAFACLCVALGGYVSYHWIFTVDGPRLLELPDGPAAMGLVRLGFFGAMCLAALMFLVLAGRLVIDKLNYGRPAVTPAPVLAAAAASPAPAGFKADDLPPIPVHVSPLGVMSSGIPAAAPAAAPRLPGPVKKLTGIGGIYLGSSFDLSPGEHSIGRAEAEILLSEDNQVSRRHAAIRVDSNGNAELVDLGSTNGTSLNNQRIHSEQLAPGDVIRLGTSLFKVE